MVISLVILSQRNIYDDEFSSYKYILMPLQKSCHMINSADVQPPGMYVIGHMFYALIGSERWMTLGPLCVLYTGILFFAWRGLSCFDRNWKVSFVFIVMCLLHPQLLMWGNSIRWYPYWTGLALIVIVTGLRVGQEKLNPSGENYYCPSKGACLWIGLIMSAMFYINYITLIFLPAFVAAWLVRYRVSRQTFIRLVLTNVAFVIPAIPQFLPFLSVHMKMAGSQKGPLLASLCRLIHGVFLGEALLPWHPISPVFLLVVVIPCMLIILKQFIVYVLRVREGLLFEDKPLWVAFVVFFSAMFGLGAILGLGCKARSFLILAPLMAFLLCVGMMRLRSYGFQIVIAIVVLIWSLSGSYNLIVRQGTAKAGINDHPEEIVSFIAERQRHTGKKAIIFTADPGVTYALNSVAGKYNWHICSACSDYIHKIPRGTLSPSFDPEMIFVIKSYVGSSISQQKKFQVAYLAAKQSILKSHTEFLSKDRDLWLKKMVPGVKNITKDLPEYRFEVAYGAPKPNVKWADIADKFSYVNRKFYE